MRREPPPIASGRALSSPTRACSPVRAAIPTKPYTRRLRLSSRHGDQPSFDGLAASGTRSVPRQAVRRSRGGVDTSWRLARLCLWDPVAEHLAPLRCHSSSRSTTITVIAKGRSILVKATRPVGGTLQCPDGAGDLARVGVSHEARMNLTAIDRGRLRLADQRDQVSRRADFPHRRARMPRDSAARAARPGSPPSGGVGDRHLVASRRPITSPRHPRSRRWPRRTASRAAIEHPRAQGAGRPKRPDRIGSSAHADSVSRRACDSTWR